MTSWDTLASPTMSLSDWVEFDSVDLVNYWLQFHRVNRPEQ